MKAPRALCGCLLSILLCVAAFAQGRPGGGRGNPGGSRGNAPTVGAPTPSRGVAGATSATSAFISGKVILDDGTPVSEPAAIETICLGNRHTVTYSDSSGGFSFQFGDPVLTASADLSDASNNMMTRGENQQQSLRNCEIQAVLAGFTSEVIELAGRVDVSETGDVGRVRLHRIGQVEGSSISVTSALAPDNAKKALQKGREAEKKGEWDKARQSFEKAVHIYPKYAAAWYELGRVQLQKNDLAAAKESFQQSVNADPKYVNPYYSLALLAFKEQHWPDVLDSTGKLLAIDPVDFPNAYFLNGIANYYQHNFDAADKIVRQGIKIDDTHRVPKLQYLLGMILLQKHDYPGASDSLKQYLQLTKEPADIAEAQKELAEIEKRTGKASVAEEKR